MRVIGDFCDIHMKSNIGNMSLDEKPDKALDVMETTPGRSGKVFTPAVAENLTAISQLPSPWGNGHRSLYLFCALIYLCSTMNGKSNLSIQPLSS
jgi:hypothetical protein